MFFKNFGIYLQVHMASQPPPKKNNVYVFIELRTTNVTLYEGSVFSVGFGLAWPRLFAVYLRLSG